MTGHGVHHRRRAREAGVESEASQIGLLAQKKCRTADFEEEVFAPYSCAPSMACRWRSSARPFPTRRSTPRRLNGRLDLFSGIPRKPQLQEEHRRVWRAKGARAPSCCSPPTAADVDLKMATRSRGLDAILGGHNETRAARAGGAGPACWSARPWVPMPIERQVPRKCSIGRSDQAAQQLSLQVAYGVFESPRRRLCR